MEVDNELYDRLISIYFRKSYQGFGEVTKEEWDFITQNTFYVIVTEETKNNGYAHDSEKVNKYLKLNTPYTLGDLDVGQSSSGITLQEFPSLTFNFVNFLTLKLNA